MYQYILAVTCNDDVFLGPSMVFTNIINPRSAIIREINMLKLSLIKGLQLVLMQLLFAVIE